MEYIQVTKENIDTFLELFGKDRDKEGFIIDKKTGKRLFCPYSGNYIHSDDFTILPCSATFVSNKSSCFAEHIVSKKVT